MNKKILCFIVEKNGDIKILGKKPSLLMKLMLEASSEKYSGVKVISENAEKYTSDDENEYTAVLFDDTPLVSGCSIRRCAEMLEGDQELDIASINGKDCGDGRCAVYVIRAGAIRKHAGEVSLEELVLHPEKFNLNILQKTDEDNDEFTRLSGREKHIISLKIREHIIRNLTDGGVDIIDPSSTVIDPGVVIGSGTVIYPSCVIEGKTVIGKNCRIGLNTRLNNMIIADNVDIDSSVCFDSSIGFGTHVGPFAYVRPGSRIGANVKVGDFVEVKNSVIGDNSKASHLTYIGDSDVGENVNFGCGTVTVNYDGSNKYRATVHDGAFIGCNTNLISPVSIGRGAYIAAGSTITDNVPEDSLAIARARQVNKSGWKRPKK